MQLEHAWYPPKLESAAWHGPAGEYALACEPYSEADPVGVLVSTLIAFGNATNRGASFQPGGQTHHANENAILVGLTASGRKGEAMQLGLRPFRIADETWWRERVQRGFGSGEAIVAAVQDGTGDEPVDKRLLLHEDEFATVLAVAERQGATISAHIRNAWDGRPLQNRVKDKTQTLVATDAHVSVLAAITPAELLRKTSETELTNGFLNRFLLVAVRRSRLLAEPPPIPQAFDSEHADRFGAALTWARKQGSGRLERTPAARELWAYAYAEELSVDRFGLAGAVCSRAEAHTLRLSMLYALLDRSPVIDVEHVHAALALWRYSEATARLIFGDRTGDSIADTILADLRANGGEITKTDAHKLFGRHRSARDIDASIALLEKARLAKTETRASGGRPTIVIRLLSLTSLNSHAQNGNGAVKNSEISEESDLRACLRTSEESEESEESHHDWLAHLDAVIDTNAIDEVA